LSNVHSAERGALGRARPRLAEADSIDLRKGDALYLNDGAYGNLFDAAHVDWPFPVKHIRDEASRAKMAPFRFYGPTCDSIDAAKGLFLLPADVREGDYIEIGMLGAYSTAMGTRFNGFGETLIVECEDAPWASMFVEEAAEAQPGIIRLADRKRRPRRK
jgi:ornithine decarboxylase